MNIVGAGWVPSTTTPHYVGIILSLLTEGNETKMVWDKAISSQLPKDTWQEAGKAKQEARLPAQLISHGPNL